MSLAIETVTGEALLPHVPALSRLRATVFAEWPYLYQAKPDDEGRYLQHFIGETGAAIILARDGAETVGAATCQPMLTAHAPVRDAFTAAGRDLATHCYFGESVLLPRYRGQGTGVAFFAAREAHARSLGLRFAAFCGVVRNVNDPRRPADYTPLDAFWRKRGYTHHPEISAVFRWRELEEEQETPHSLSFWIRELT
ncbi:MAG: acetyltransferase [Rubritepida sp.]|nr:acetyltransferase [Rubritepida sp.]